MKPETQQAIEAERAYQDAKWPQDAAPLPPSDAIRLIRVIVEQADSSWYTTQDSIVNGVKVNLADLIALRKIAAVAIRGMDQWGAVPRKV